MGAAALLLLGMGAAGLLLAADGGVALPQRGERGDEQVPNVSDPQFLLDCPVDCLVDFFNNLPVVFRDVILQVDDHKCTVSHFIILLFLTP